MTKNDELKTSHQSPVPSEPGARGVLPECPKDTLAPGPTGLGWKDRGLPRGVSTPGEFPHPLHIQSTVTCTLTAVPTPQRRTDSWVGCTCPVPRSRPYLGL